MSHRDNSIGCFEIQKKLDRKRSLSNNVECLIIPVPIKIDRSSLDICLELNLKLQAARFFFNVLGIISPSLSQGEREMTLYVWLLRKYNRKFRLQKFKHTFFANCDSARFEAV